MLALSLFIVAPQAQERPGIQRRRWVASRSERYDRELADVFAVQDEIAAAIAGALQGKLTGKPVALRLHQPNLASYDALLKGRHQMAKISPEGYARATEYFERAVALDPEYAEAHAELGFALL